MSERVIQYAEYVPWLKTVALSSYPPGLSTNEVLESSTLLHYSFALVYSQAAGKSHQHDTYIGDLYTSRSSLQNMAFI